MDKKGTIWMIPPKILNKKPDYGIIDDIKRKNLAIEFFLLQDEKQNEKI